MRTLSWILVLVFLASGCPNNVEENTDPSVMAPEDAGTDSAVPDGAQSLDSSVIDGEAGGPVVDGSMEPCSCVALSECRTAACVQGQCVMANVADGTMCGESSTSICVTGECRARGCGDGFLEPGPTPARERCDDGNALGGDACSPACEPTILVVDEAIGSAYDARPLGRQGAIGVDGAGALLFVGTRNRFSRVDLVARRATASGVFLPTGGSDFIVLDETLANVESASPVVTGLPGGGWVVVWSAPRAGTPDILARTIQSNGALGPTMIVNVVRAGAQEDPSVTIAGDTVVIGWTDRHVTDSDPFGGVRARRFTSTLDTLGGEIVLATSRDHAEQGVSLASSNSVWIAGWTRRGGTLPAPRVALRRFENGAALDLAEVSLDGVNTADEPHLIGVSSMNVVFLTVRTFDADPLGDVRSGIFSAADLSVGFFGGELASETALAERSGWLAMSPDASESFVTIEDDTPSRVYVLNSNNSSDPKVSALNAVLATGGYDHSSIVAGRNGFWVSWSGTLPGHADRCSLAFSVPYGAAQ